jgi:hypothetical protein
MDPLFLVAGLVVMLYAAVRLRYRLDDFSAVASVVRGAGARSTRDWPVGVQEEDRDHPWGRSPGSEEPPQGLAVGPSLEPVKPALRVR